VDVSKYRPISLLNVAGQLLDKLMIEFYITCIPMLI